MPLTSLIVVQDFESPNSFVECYTVPAPTGTVDSLAHEAEAGGVLVSILRDANALFITHDPKLNGMAVTAYLPE